MAATVLRVVEWKATERDTKPDVSFVPMMERRRLTAVERAALHVAWKMFHGEGSESVASLSESEIPVVFASRWGEIGTTLKLIRQMHDENEMSPAGFSSSVHNAAPGAWSIFTKNHAAYTSIAARDRTYDIGLMEATSQVETSDAKAVLYVYAEESTPDYYLPEFGRSEVSRACAMLLTRSEEG